MTSFTPMTLQEGRARRKNSIVIGLVLLVLVASFYIVTIVKLQGNVAKRMSMESRGAVQSGKPVSTSTSKAAAPQKAGAGQGNK